MLNQHPFRGWISRLTLCLLAIIFLGLCKILLAFMEFREGRNLLLPFKEEALTLFKVTS